MKNMIISLRRVTFLKNNWRLNFASCWTSFSSFGSRTRMAAFIEFHRTVISSWICGETPFARVVRFLSFRAYHRFSPFRIRSRGIMTRPKNSTLWSRSSSNTVTSSTDDMSFTLLEITEKFHVNWFYTTDNLTYNVNILFQFGVNVLYSVCVCNLLLTNSRTQNGSDFPPISADAKPVAP